MIKKFQSLEKSRGKSSNHWNFFTAIFCGAALLYAAIALVPFPIEKLAYYPSSTIITDRQGGILSVRLGPDDLDCRPDYVPSAEDWVVKAVIAAEDQRFWSHAGLDPIALARAIRQNLTAGRRVSGASTISTQVIRLIEPRPRHLLSKAIEAFRAIQLERICTKQEILQQYLNRAPFGGNIVGIEAAAQRYFSKQAKDLNLAEASLLAGLPQSPSRLRPDRHPARAKKRQAYVLSRMAECAWISEHDRDDALARKMDVRLQHYPMHAPHFTAAVNTPVGHHGDCMITTTLDPHLQQIAEETLRRNLAARAASHGAVVILDAKSSALRAMVGSPDFNDHDAGQVNAAMAPRAAGSTLKPFAYALAMDRGLMTPQTVLTDVPTRFRDYAPDNFDPTYRGLVSLHDALVLSLNLPAIEVVRRVGQPLFHQTLQSLGLRTVDQPADHYGVGIVIGNCEVRLIDLANAYACLARGGDYLPVQFEENESTTAPQSIFSREACWLITDIMSGDERAMDTTRHAADVHLPSMAWKTGTSAGLRDAWTIAYNPEYVIGVWIGDPAGGSSEAFVGREMATPVAWDILRRMYPDNASPWYERPPGLARREVCAISGRPHGTACEVAATDWFIEGVSRHELCPAHQGGPMLSIFAPRTSIDVARPDIARLKILSPANGSTFQQVDDFEALSQQLSLSASGTDSSLFWFVNDKLIGTSAAGSPLFWPLEPGQHQIVCSTAQGQSDRVTITVQ